MTILRKAILILTLALCQFAMAQRTEVRSRDIGHVRVSVNGDEARLPVITLGSSDVLVVEFDALTPEYQRYTWSVDHCTPEWYFNEGLHESEYLRGSPSDSPIEHYEESSLTATLYAHYRFVAVGNQPGAVMPTASGNYCISVFADEENEPIMFVYFMVVENSATLAVSATVDTDIDYRQAHQQLNVTADVGALNLFNYATETKLVCIQNRSPFFTVYAPEPTYTVGTQLKWEHCRQLIFPAGNEYRKFEMPSTRTPGMHVDFLRYDGESYVAQLLPDIPYRSYFYDEDQNGRSLILTERGGDADTEADYVWTRFILECEEKPNAEVFVDGRWTEITDKYLMWYDESLQAYCADILLKQGYYSYRYMALEGTAQGAIAYNVDGNYYQTENEYATFLYYRPAGSRYWHLAAYNVFQYTP